MNKNIKKVACRILEKDRLAREDDWYLIQQVLIEMLPCKAGTAFGQVLQGMKYKGISFEAITRCRRRFMQENPHLKTENMKNVRREEEEEYYLEYSRHIPKKD